MVRAGLELYKQHRPAEAKYCDAALAKMELAEMPVKAGTGIAIGPATEAFRGVLGNRLVLPPSGAGAVWGAMGRRLKMLNLTAGDCVTIAKVASVEWAGPIKAESLVRQAETLLSNAQLEIPAAKRTTPVELNDDDY